MRSKYFSGMAVLELATHPATQMVCKCHGALCMKFIHAVLSGRHVRKSASLVAAAPGMRTSIGKQNGQKRMSGISSAQKRSAASGKKMKNWSVSSGVCIGSPHQGRNTLIRLWRHSAQQLKSMCRQKNTDWGLRGSRHNDLRSWASIGTQWGCKDILHITFRRTYAGIRTPWPGEEIQQRSFEKLVQEHHRAVKKHSTTIWAVMQVWEHNGTVKKSRKQFAKVCWQKSTTTPEKNKSLTLAPVTLRRGCTSKT